jgi:D-aspartate ligase
MGGHMGSAISVARSLGRAGARVYLLGEPQSPERYSRYITYIPLPGGRPAEQLWADFLLSALSEPLRGAVLLACSDAGIEVILRNRERLAEKFRLDISDPQAQECALNKLCTYMAAEEAGVPAPRFWWAKDLEEVHARRDEFVYPLLLKPLYSHKFSSMYGKKFILARDLGQLLEAFADVQRHQLEIVLLELIPGPDDRLCSYFTYTDEEHTRLFDFTKRVIRRYPENQGLACYHITDWIPEVAELGAKLLTQMGLLGLGNVEFKRDERDGKLKVIEVNARFTAANPVIAASGYDLGLFVYNRIVGRPQASLKHRPYRGGMRLWYPENDAKAFLELRGKGKLTLRQWVGSLLHPQVLPYFRWYDPAPSAVSAARLAQRLSTRLARSLNPARGA